MNKDQIRFIGRHIEKSNRPFFAFSGCGFEFEFTPSSFPCSCTLLLSSVTRGPDVQYIGIYVNGDLYKKEALVKGQNTIEISLQGPANLYLIRVIKLNEVVMSEIYVVGVTLANGRFKTIEPSPKPLIGFFGDSITCGYGLNALGDQPFSVELEDFSKSYAYLASIALDMDYSVVAKSGIALGCNFVGNKMFNEIVDTVDTSHHYVEDRSLNYAVINLGTNDGWAMAQRVIGIEEGIASFKKEYLRLIERIVKANPNVKLVLCYNMMPLDERMKQALSNIASYVKEHYENPCLLLEFEPNEEAIMGHPYYTAHEEYGKVLANAIRSLNS